MAILHFFDRSFAFIFSSPHYPNTSDEDFDADAEELDGEVSQFKNLTSILSHELPVLGKNKAYNFM